MHPNLLVHYKRRYRSSSSRSACIMLLTSPLSVQLAPPLSVMLPGPVTVLSILISRTMFSLFMVAFFCHVVPSPSPELRNDWKEIELPPFIFPSAQSISRWSRIFFFCGSRSFTSGHARDTVDMVPLRRRLQQNIRTRLVLHSMGTSAFTMSGNGLWESAINNYEVSLSQTMA